MLARFWGGKAGAVQGRVSSSWSLPGPCCHGVHILGVCREFLGGQDAVLLPQMWAALLLPVPSTALCLVGGLALLGSRNTWEIKCLPSSNTSKTQSNSLTSGGSTVDPGPGDTAPGTETRRFSSAGAVWLSDGLGQTWGASNQECLRVYGEGGQCGQMGWGGVAAVRNPGRCVGCNKTC